MLAVQEMQKFKPGSTGVSRASKKRSQSGVKRKVTKAKDKSRDGCVDILANDPFAAEQSLVDIDEPMNTEDKERVAIVKQIQEQIVKRGDESAGVGGDDEEYEIERLLHGYVSMCHNASMEFMKTNQQRAAGRMLRQCEDFVGAGVPRNVAQIVLKKGILHTVYNNLAQHSNMVADMNTSLEYLEKALEAAERPEAEQDLLPLAETYLNLANGFSFLTKYDSALTYAEKALKFSRIRCNAIREEIQQERFKGEDGPNTKLESLDFQLNDFIAIKVMAHLCVGEQHEKLCNYNAAIKFFSEGKQFAETNFGTRHPLYTKCANAMGGARLKSKYQTKENYRQATQPSSEQKPPIATKAKKAKKVLSQASKDKNRMMYKHQENNQVRSKLMARKQSSLANISQQNSSSRRNIQDLILQNNKVKKDTEAQMTQRFRNHQDNLLLSNFDSWTAMKNRNVRPVRRQSLMVSMEKKRLRDHRERSISSARSDRKLSHSQRITKEVLDGMSDNKRAPYQVICKVGPSCKNHDWNSRAPLKKVCKKGPSCNNHDWDASMRSSFKSTRSARTIQTPQPAVQVQVQEQTYEATPALTEVDTQSVTAHEASVIEVQDTKSQSNHSCMLQQTERVHHQQMQHMRTMQDDQFKMLQLVIDNQQANQTSQQSQQQQPYPQMYYPQHMMQQYAHPQFYAQSGYQYPYMYNQQQQYQPDETDQSYYTETEQSDTEQVREGKRPDQSELSQYEQVMSRQQLHMHEMEKRMAEMQTQYQQQVESLRASHNAFKDNNKKEHTLSASSERRMNSYKDFKEDSSVDEQNDEVRFGGSKLQKNGTSHRALMRDQSAQINDSFAVQNSIMKHSTIQSRAGATAYRSVSPVKDLNYSMPRTDLSCTNRSNRSRPVSGKSGHQSSFITEKSFRMPREQLAIGKDEAATRIQKTYKGFRERQDYRMIKKCAQKKFLFRATARGQTAQIISCSVNLAAYGRPQSLIFILQEARRPQHNLKIQIDLRRFDIKESTDLKDKVLRIIRDALGDDNIMASIEDMFKTELAREIIEAEFFSSDDQLTLRDSSAHASASALPVQQSMSCLEDIYEEQQVISNQQMLIDAEIERIRKRCDIQYRVNVDKVCVEGHVQRYDDYEKEDAIDDEMRQHTKIDSDDESREIAISSVNVRRNGGVAQELISDNDSDLTQHEYEFVMRTEPMRVERKFNMRQIVMVQAMVRGFLARLHAKYKRHVLYVKIIRRNDQLVRFTLTKNRRNNYSLMAQVTLKRHMKQTKQLTHLPFPEDDAKENFERCLLFNCDDEEITELDLVFSGVPDHKFIMDYKEIRGEGENLIKAFFLRDQYPCELYETKEGNGDAVKHQFRVVVKHQNISHYVMIKKLPVDIEYMVYYLNELLFLALSDQDVFIYTYMKQMMSKGSFVRRMEDLWMRIFGVKKSEMPDGVKPLSNISATINVERTKFETQAAKIKDFVVARHGWDYVVHIFDETEKTGKYKIYVKRQGCESDNDWINVQQLTLNVDDFISYLKQNLKIELKADGNIDYLSLAHSYSLCNTRNLRRVQQAVQAKRQNSIDNHGESKGKVEEQSQEACVVQLSNQLEEFTIERNNRTYTAQLQTRNNIEGQPLQITVTAQDDYNDTKYMVYHNKKNLKIPELVTYLEKHLLIYTRWDSDHEREYIDYIALTQRPEEYRRSATVSLSSKDSITSKRNVIKARAGKLKDSHSDGNNVSIEINQNMSFVSQSLQNSSRMPQFESEQRVDASWQELTRSIVTNEGRRLLVHLYGKKEDKSRIPLLKGRCYTEYMKILVVEPSSSMNVASVNLSVQQSYRILMLDSAQDLQIHKSAFLSIQEIMQGQTQEFDQSQLDQLKTSCSYKVQRQAWNHIIKSVSYQEGGSKQVKFDVWSICQHAAILSMSPKKIQTVGISSKLTSQRPQNNQGAYSYANALKSAAASINCDEEERTAVPEDEHLPTRFKIVRKINQSQQHEATFSPQSNNTVDFPPEDEEQAQRRCQSIVKSVAGFLNVVLTQNGGIFSITVTDRVHRSRKLCENLVIPTSFIQQIEMVGSDRFDDVKKAVEERLKTSADVTSTDGRLYIGIFI